jgi:CRP-like cAMP-binding protein
MRSRAAAGPGWKATEPNVVLAASSSQLAGSVPRLFNGLNDWDIAEIMSAAVLRRLEAGQIIFHADVPGTHLFLVKTGAVDYYRLTSQGQQVLMTQLLPGDHLGFVTMLAKPVGYMGTAETTRETLVYVWEHVWIRHFIAKEPRLMENAFRIALEYINVYSDRHLALVSDAAEDRLRKTIAHLGSQVGHRHPRGLEFEITNERLSSLADVGYYTTSRLLNKWKRVGAITKDRGKIIVLRPEKMLV